MQLQYAQEEQVKNMIASNEIETRRGANQISTLQQAGDTTGDLIFNLFVV